MKLIIDISEDVYTRLFDNGIQDSERAVDDVCEMARALRIGTPLDDVKKEIFKLIGDTDSIYGTSALHSVLDILDRIGKESEE